MGDMAQPHAEYCVVRETRFHFSYPFFSKILRDGKFSFTDSGFSAKDAKPLFFYVLLPRKQKRSCLYYPNILRSSINLDKGFYINKTSEGMYHKYVIRCIVLATYEAALLEWLEQDIRTEESPQPVRRRSDKENLDTQLVPTRP